MGSHVDLLFKSELNYELIVRGVKVDERTNVNDLRKQLRSVLKLNIEPSPHNLYKVLNIPDEIKTIQVAVEELKLKIQDCDKNKRVVDFLKCKAKFNHYKLRSTILSSFKVSEEFKKSVEEIKLSLSECENNLKQVDVDKELESGIERKLSESVEEEEEIELNVKSKLNSSMNFGITPSHSEYNMFAKLSNPIEKHLKYLKTTNGLNVNELLDFIKVMLKLNKETQLPHSQVLDLLLGYTTGPLYNKLVECKQLNKSCEEAHVLLLNSFVPLGLRENLKRDFVNRPQKHHEPLNCYIIAVKENAKLLNCIYSEAELVKLIIMGLNQVTRCRLALTKEPSNFEELELLCVHEQNVAYEDTRRGVVKSRVASIQSNNVPMKCYNCNKLGHIARYCRQQSRYRPGGGNQVFPNSSHPVNQSKNAQSGVGTKHVSP